MLPIIRDFNGEFSGSCCPPKPGIKELHRVHRKLPPRCLDNDDQDVLQDEAGFAFNDEITNGYIYDDLRFGANIGEPGQFMHICTPEVFTLPEQSPECVPIIMSPCNPRQVECGSCNPPPCHPVPRPICPAVCPPGPTGPPGPPGTSTIEEITAAEDLPAFTVIVATGKVANSSDASHQGRVIGITLGAILSGQTGQFISEGTVENPAWSWTPGDILFLNGTSISTTPPILGFSQQVAVAETSTAIFFDLEAPVLL
jgi:hypothetical protein